MTITSIVSYTSVERVHHAFPAISSVSNINSAVVAQYAESVESEINAKIAKRYVLPILVAVPLLVAIATRETIYRIAVQRALVQFPPAQQGRHPMQTQHIDDQKLLEQISNGEVTLIGVDGVAIAGNTADVEMYSTTKDYIPTFHEGSILDTVQDPSKLKDILDDRNLP